LCVTELMFDEEYGSGVDVFSFGMVLLEVGAAAIAIAMYAWSNCFVNLSAYFVTLHRS
jgi:hypothetical protein